MNKIENIKTELGNQIIKTLLSEGWKVVSEYSPFTIDKGIDFDSYTLKKGDQVIEFEWDNWDEWEITGELLLIEEIKDKFNLI